MRNKSLAWILGIIMVVIFIPMISFGEEADDHSEDVTFEETTPVEAQAPVEDNGDSKDDSIIIIGGDDTQSGVCGDDLAWTLEDGMLTISGTGDMTDYSLSSGVPNPTPAPWFDYRQTITGVTICDGATSIGAYAFYSCSNLTSVTVPNSVTKIGSGAFCECSSLTTVPIPSGVTSLGFAAFYNCSRLTSITIPNSVTSIGGNAFYNCSNLTDITISNSVTSIGDQAFYNCSNLTDITMPNNMTSLGKSTFYGCSKLTSIAIPEGITSLEHSVFSDCNSLSDITIPNSVTSIANRAFNNCSRLTSITIPNSVTSIGLSAFYNCSNLTNITMPNNMTSLGSGAFYGCSKLTSIAIPEGITNIEGSTFSGCSSLTFVTIPDGVVSIGTYAFQFCTKLESVAIPESVTSIGDYAFDGCSAYGGSALASITIPENVTSIGDYALPSFVPVTVLCEPPVSITKAFASVNRTIKYPCTSGWTEEERAFWTTRGEWVPLHAIGEIISETEPTCTQGAVLTFICADCGNTVAEESEPLGHDYETTIVEPTCIKMGYVLHQCTRCSYNYKDSYTRSTGHQWQHNVNPAGYLVNGNEYDECSACHAKQNEAVLPGWANYYVKGLKVTKGSKSFAVKWKKQSKKNLKKFNGYQIMYATKSDMSDAKYKTAGKKATSKKIGKLKKKTKYYVQVRTYTKSNGVTYYSKWSPKKTVKTK